MAVAKLRQAEAPAQAGSPEEPTFTYTMGDGTSIECGKPRGVLKLKLRNLLPKDLMEDMEIRRIAEAFLSIRKVNGATLWMTNNNHFEAFMNRFKDDDDLNGFMEKYNELVNPEQTAALAKALQEAKDKKIPPREWDDYITQRMIELSDENLERIKD